MKMSRKKTSRKIKRAGRHGYRTEGLMKKEVALGREHEKELTKEIN